MPLSAREQRVSLRIDSQFDGRGLNDATRALGRMGSAAQAQAQTLAYVGAQMSAVGTMMVVQSGVMAGALAYSAVELGRFRNELALASTQAIDTNVTIERLQATAHRVGRAFAVDMQQIPAVFYDIYSTVDATMSQTAPLLENFAKAAIAGQADLQTVSQQTMNLMNAFAIDIDDSSRVLDTMASMIQFGTGTMDQFMSVIGQVSPAAVAAGQDLETMAASLGFMTRMGLSTSMSATSVARAFELLTQPRVVASMEAHGIAMRDLAGELLPVDEIMRQVAESFEGMSKPEMFAQLNEFFAGAGNRIQARRFFQMVLENFDLFETGMERVRSGLIDFEDQYETMADTLPMVMQRMSNQFLIIFHQLGEEFTPMLVGIVERLEQFTEALTDLSGPQRELIANAAQATVLMLGVSGAVLTVAGAMVAWKAVLKLTGVSLGIILGKAALAVGVIGGLIAVLAALTINFQSVQEFLTNFGVGLLQSESAILAVSAALALMVAKFSGPLMSAMAAFGTGFVNTMRNIKNAQANAAAERARYIAGERAAIDRAAADWQRYHQRFVAHKQEAKAATSAQMSALGKHGAFAKQQYAKVQAAHRQVIATRQDLDRVQQSTFKNNQQRVQAMTLANKNLEKAEQNYARVAKQAQKDIKKDKKATMKVVKAQREKVVSANRSMGAATLGMRAAQQDQIVTARNLSRYIHQSAGAKAAWAAAMRGVAAAGRGLMAVLNFLGGPKMFAQIGLFMALGYAISQIGRASREASQRVSHLEGAMRSAGDAGEEFDVSRGILDTLRALEDTGDLDLKGLREAGVRIRDIQQAAQRTPGAITDIINTLADYHDVTVDTTDTVRLYAQAQEWANATIGSGMGATHDVTQAQRQFGIQLMMVLDAIGLTNEAMDEAVENQRDYMLALDPSISSSTVYRQALRAGKTDIDAMALALSEKNRLYEEGAHDALAAAEVEGYLFEETGEMAWEAQGRAKDYRDTMQSIVSPTGAFTRALEENRDAIREQGQEAEWSSKRIDEAVRTASVSASQWISEMDADIAIHEQFWSDMGTVISRSTGDIQEDVNLAVAEIFAMGEAAPAAMEALANADPEEFLQILENIRMMTIWTSDEVATHVDAIVSIFTRNLDEITEATGVAAEDVPALITQMLNMAAEAVHETGGELGYAIDDALQLFLDNIEDWSDDPIEAWQAVLDMFAYAVENFADEDLPVSAEQMMALLAEGIEVHGDSGIDAMQDVMDAMEIIADDGGGLIAQALVNRFSEGLNGVLALANRFGQSLAATLNQLLGALGEPTIGLSSLGTRLPTPGRMEHINTGGVVPGTGPDRDSVLAALTPGEFVLRRTAVNRLSRQSLEQLNRTGDPSVLRPRHYPGYNTGGWVMPEDLAKPPTFDQYGTPWREPAVATTQRMYDEAVKFVEKHSPALVLNWLKQVAGLPYVWGGVGPGGYDCSGIWSAIQNVLEGRHPHARRFTTASFAGGTLPPGWVRGAHGPVVVGVRQGSPGHMAGSIAGVNIESGSRGVVVGPGAASPFSFPQQFSLVLGSGLNASSLGVGDQEYAMAKGGIVTSPIHALLGEAGPEAVIPLDRYSTNYADFYKEAFTKLYDASDKLVRATHLMEDYGKAPDWLATRGRDPWGREIKPWEIRAVAEGAETADEWAAALEEANALLEQQQELIQQRERYEQKVERQRAVREAERALSEAANTEERERAQEQLEAAEQALQDWHRSNEEASRERLAQTELERIELKAQIAANKEQYYFDKMSAEERLQIIQTRLAAERRYTDEWMSLKQQEIGMIEEVANAAANAAREHLQILQGVQNYMSMFYSSGSHSLGGAISGIVGFNALPMAEGGVVTKPINALVGEAGPEAVIPLDRWALRRGGGTSTGGSDDDGGSLSLDEAKHELDLINRRLRIDELEETLEKIEEAGVGGYLDEEAVQNARDELELAKKSLETSEARVALKEAELLAVERNIEHMDDEVAALLKQYEAEYYLAKAKGELEESQQGLISAEESLQKAKEDNIVTSDDLRIAELELKIARMELEEATDSLTKATGGRGGGGGGGLTRATTDSAEAALQAAIAELELKIAKQELKGAIGGLLGDTGNVSAFFAMLEGGAESAAEAVWGLINAIAGLGMDLSPPDIDAPDFLSGGSSGGSSGASSISPGSGSLKYKNPVTGSTWIVGAGSSVHEKVLSEGWQQLAKGGIALAKRRGVIANIAEAGQDEAVLPLPQGARRFIAGIDSHNQRPTEINYQPQYNIEIHGGGSDLEDTIRHQLEEHDREFVDMLKGLGVSTRL